MQFRLYRSVLLLCILSSFSRPLFPLNLLNLHITRTEQFMDVLITRLSPYVCYLLTNKYSLRVFSVCPKSDAFPLKATKSLTNNYYNYEITYKDHRQSTDPPLPPPHTKFNISKISTYNSMQLAPLKMSSHWLRLQAACLHFINLRSICIRRKYSKMDKRAKDKLVRSPRENGGG